MCGVRCWRHSFCLSCKDAKDASDRPSRRTLMFTETCVRGSVRPFDRRPDLTSPRRPLRVQDVSANTSEIRFRTSETGSHIVSLRSHFLLSARAITHTAPRRTQGCVGPGGLMNLLSSLLLNQNDRRDEHGTPGSAGSLTQTLTQTLPAAADE